MASPIATATWLAVMSPRMRIAAAPALTVPGASPSRTTVGFEPARQRRPVRRQIEEHPLRVNGVDHRHVGPESGVDRIGELLCDLPRGVGIGDRDRDVAGRHPAGLVELKRLQRSEGVADPDPFSVGNRLPGHVGHRQGIAHVELEADVRTAGMSRPRRVAHVKVIAVAELVAGLGGQDRAGHWFDRCRGPGHLHVARRAEVEPQPEVLDPANELRSMTA